MANATSTKPAPAPAKPAEAKATPSPATVEAAKPAVTYLPATDSTPDQQKRAGETGRVVLDLRKGACLCGCKGAAQGRFQPGHDARLKGKLTRAALNNVGLLILIDMEDGTPGEAQITPRQLAAKLSTGKYNWAEALDANVARAKELAKAAEVRKAEAAKKAAERKAESAKEGRGKISLADFAK